MKHTRLETLASMNLCEGDFRACFPLPALMFIDAESSVESDINLIKKASTPWTTRVPSGEKVLTNDAKNSRVFFLEKTRNNLTGGIAIGRDPTNDLVIDIPTVSKSHCVLVKPHGSPWYVIDCKSSNGTQVDGKPIAPGKPIQLRDGSKITFANEIDAKFYMPGGLWALVNMYQGLKMSISFE
jgi:pSer/pThr/pTyr-binding forkhead associated (FHA) protein